MGSYQNIAPYYSRIMSHVDYTMWAGLLLTYMDEIKHTPQNLLELAGGDGKLAHILKEYVSKYTLTDLSSEMLAQSTHEDKVECDMRDIPFDDSSLDTLLTIYDSVNYLVEIGDLELHFKEAARVLSQSGVYIFDSVTQVNCKTYFQDYLDFEEHDDADIIREGWYDDQSQIQMTRFIIYQKDKVAVSDKQSSQGIQKIEETHQQKIWSEDEIRLAAENSGFKILNKYCGFTTELADEKSERIHWVLKKI